MATLTESFDQTDSTTLGPTQTWTEYSTSGGLLTASNEARRSGVASDALAVASNALSGSDMECQVTFTQLASANFAGPTIRCNSGNQECIALVVSGNTTIYCRLFHRSSAGAWTQIGTTVTGTAPATPFTASVRGVGSTITGYINGALVITGTAGTPLLSNVRAGFTINNGGDHRLDDWIAADGTIAPANSITLGTPLANQFKQQVGGEFAYTLSGNYAGSPASIEYQIDSDGWVVGDAAPSSNAFSFAVDVPTGRHTIAVRFSDDTGTTDSVTNVSVGDVYIVAGQSNAMGRLTNKKALTGGRTMSLYREDGTDATDWLHIDDEADVGHTDFDRLASSEGSLWPLVADILLTADSATPVAFITTADDGVEIDDEWAGDGGGESDGTVMADAKAAIAASGINGARAIIWHQGEADTKTGMTTSQWVTELQRVYARLASGLSPAPNIYVAQLMHGQVLFTGIDEIRQAQNDVLNGTTIRRGLVLNDRVLAEDNVHIKNDTDAALAAARWVRALSAADDYTITHATATGSTITLTYSRTLATDAALDTSLWTAVSDAQGALTITGVAASGNQVSIGVTETIAPSDDITVGYANGLDAATDGSNNADIADLPRDANGDPAPCYIITLTSGASAVPPITNYYRRLRVA